MKRYVRPMMDAQMFVANEFVSSCADQYETLSCLNMGMGKSDQPKAIYIDTNKNGVLDEDETQTYTGWDFKNDCGSTGDPTGGNHNLKGIDLSGLTRVIVVGKDDSKTPAYVVETNLDNSPHFISVKTANFSG